MVKNAIFYAIISGVQDVFGTLRQNDIEFVFFFFLPHPRKGGKNSCQNTKLECLDNTIFCIKFLIYSKIPVLLVDLWTSKHLSI